MHQTKLLSSRFQKKYITGGLIVYRVLLSVTGICKLILRLEVSMFRHTLEIYTVHI